MSHRPPFRLGALALAAACLTAACATPSLPETRSRQLQALEAGDAAIQVKTLDLASGELSLEIAASEAILALTNPTDLTLNVQAIFEGTERAAARQVSALGHASLDECGLRPHRKLPAIKPRLSLRALEEPTPSHSFDATRSFVIGGDDLENPSPIPQARLVYDGAHCVIYLDDRDAAQLSPTDADALGKIFDTRTYPALTAAFGAEPEHPGDTFNFGEDRTVFLFSQALGTSLPGSAGMVDMLDFFHPDLLVDFGIHSNYAKMVYMLPSAISPMTPGTMAHEFVHVLFAMKRQATYGALHGHKEQSAFGWDPSYYLDDQTYFSEKGMNEGLAELGKFIAGYSPSDMPVAVERIGRFLGNPHLFDLLFFDGPAGSNYGGMGLFNSYVYGRNAAFPKNFLTAQGTGSAAIAEAAGIGFDGLYRDFTLAMVLDGLAAPVPNRYQIPMVNLHATYDLGFGLGPLRGANDGTAPVTLHAPRPHGVRFSRVQFPTGKGKLTISGDPQLKASLILLDPARPQGFLED